VRKLAYISILARNAPLPPPQTPSQRQTGLYFESLKQELLEQIALLKVPVSTIYFGGGTPSIVNPILIKNFLDFVRRNISLTKNPEITIECNPESITQERLDVYRQAGVNRISIGLQAWQNHHLKYLNRAHDIQKFLASYALVKKSKIKNISIDLIFGLPNQTMGEWKQTLQEVVKLNPSHISAYSWNIIPKHHSMG
jgi:oxygen-independent coproporphyrinogen-3 oxidase